MTATSTSSSSPTTASSNQLLGITIGAVVRVIDRRSHHWRPRGIFLLAKAQDEANHRNQRWIQIAAEEHWSSLQTSLLPLLRQPDHHLHSCPSSRPCSNVDPQQQHYRQHQKPLYIQRDPISMQQQQFYQHGQPVYAQAHPPFNIPQPIPTAQGIPELPHIVPAPKLRRANKAANLWGKCGSSPQNSSFAYDSLLVPRILAFPLALKELSFFRSISPPIPLLEQGPAPAVVRFESAVRSAILPNLVIS